MGNYELSGLAQQDIISIRDYTKDTWGQTQCHKYISQLQRRFECLADSPNLGKKRNDVKEGYLSYPEGRHIIFYRITEGGIEVIAVPHQSEDIERHFSK